MGFLQHWPLSFVALLTCAVASYYLVEKPLIKLGRRFTLDGAASIRAYGSA